MERLLENAANVDSDKSFLRDRAGQMLRDLDRNHWFVSSAPHCNSNKLHVAIRVKGKGTHHLYISDQASHNSKTGTVEYCKKNYILNDIEKNRINDN